LPGEKQRTVPGLEFCVTYHEARKETNAEALKLVCVCRRLVGTPIPE
jgi:hypothetical protein